MYILYWYPTEAMSYSGNHENVKVCSDLFMIITVVNICRSLEHCFIFALVRPTLQTTALPNNSWENSTQLHATVELVKLHLHLLHLQHLLHVQQPLHLQRNQQLLHMTCKPGSSASVWKFAFPQPWPELCRKSKIKNRPSDNEDECQANRTRTAFQNQG